jgi:hypothetical protein
MAPFSRLLIAAQAVAGFVCPSVLTAGMEPDGIPGDHACTDNQLFPCQIRNSPIRIYLFRASCLFLSLFSAFTFIPFAIALLSLY